MLKMPGQEKRTHKPKPASRAADKTRQRPAVSSITSVPEEDMETALLPEIQDEPAVQRPAAPPAREAGHKAAHKATEHHPTRQAAEHPSAKQPTVQTAAVRAQVKEPGGAFEAARTQRKAARAQAAEAKPRKAFNAERLAARARGRIDTPFAVICLVLLGLGLFTLYSASYPTSFYEAGYSSYYIVKQLKFVAAGLLIIFVMLNMDCRRYVKTFTWPFLGIVMAMLVYVFTQEGVADARRWVTFFNGVIRFQPSELAKLALIMAFAKLAEINEDRMDTLLGGLLGFLAVMLPMVALVVLEPHVSCTVLLVAMAYIMMYRAGTKLSHLIFSAVIMVGLTAAVLVLIPPLRTRIMERFAHQADLGYQALQSLIAIGAGGPFGRGIGQSRQKFLYLPEMQNDYIFSIWCEELGFVGALLLIGLFLALLFRGLYLAYKCRDIYTGVFVAGVTAQISLQAFLHMGVTTNLLPSTGISLPFFSSGGSAMLMLLVEVGLVLSMTRGVASTARARRPVAAHAVKQPG